MTDNPGKPLVSIGLPVYNGQNFLRLAAQSLLAQTYDHIELIISDNASTDATAQICAALAAADPRVRYSRLPGNIGAIPKKEDGSHDADSACET